MVLKSLIRRLSPPPADPLARAGVAPGLYHYVRESAGTFTRFHLRVDAGGAGMLLANATAAARLAPSGVIIAKQLLDGRDRPEIVDVLRAAFTGVNPEAAAGDVDRVERILATLDSPGDNYPVINLADPSFAAEGGVLGKPLGADVPLADPERLVPILDRLWELGIPHATFLAGENPDSKALVRVVERAEDLGLIAGVRGRATGLNAGSLAEDLARAGIDHVDLLYLSAAAASHDPLAGEGDHARAIELFRRVREAEVCPVALVPLVEATLEAVEETLASLKDLGVMSAALFAIATAEAGEVEGAIDAEQLLQAAAVVEACADALDMRCLWYPPLRFDARRPLSEQVCRGPRCSGDASILVLPDGSVVPPRGPFQSAGNLLTDDWQTIHEHEVYRRYRRRVEADTHCDDCPGLAVCAADCPRNPAGWAEENDTKKGD